MTDEAQWTCDCNITAPLSMRWLCSMCGHWHKKSACGDERTEVVPKMSDTTETQADEKTTPSGGIIYPRGVLCLVNALKRYRDFCRCFDDDRELCGFCMQADAALSYVKREATEAAGCKCLREEWDGPPKAVCDRYIENTAEDCGARCETCSHDRDCHVEPAGVQSLIDARRDALMDIGTADDLNLGADAVAYIGELERQVGELGAAEAGGGVWPPGLQRIRRALELAAHDLVYIHAHPDHPAGLNAHTRTKIAEALVLLKPAEAAGAPKLDPGVLALVRGRCEDIKRLAKAPTPRDRGTAISEHIGAIEYALADAEAAGAENKCPKCGGVPEVNNPGLRTSVELAEPLEPSGKGGGS